MPTFEGEAIRFEGGALHKRKWRTSTFDLATLATKHKLHLSYQLMDVFLASANCELEIEAENCKAAIDIADLFKVMLYLNGVSPFVIPFIATHSVNSYSGINARDSNSLRDELPQGLQQGPTSETDCIEAWPHELTLYSMHNEIDSSATAETIARAADFYWNWRELENRHRVLRVARIALQTAPTIGHLGSSILHIWQGIEALFPEVRVELKFRLSLLLAQLGSTIQPAAETYPVARIAYDLRSKIAHGSTHVVCMNDWVRAWNILTLALRGVINRKHLPTEVELIQELLSSARL